MKLIGRGESVGSRPVPIIIVSYNTLWYTRRCVESIVSFTTIPYRLYVIDNGSSDGTREWLAEIDCATKSETAFHAVEPVYVEENLGWVKGVNLGLEMALRTDPDYVVFGNSDIVVGDPLWLQRLIGPLKLDDVGAVGPISNAVMGLQHHIQNLPSLHEANFLIGICIAVKREVLDKVGLLDERFGLGGNDDLDLSIRIRKAGYRLLVNRLAFVYHYLSRTLLNVFGGLDGIRREDERTRALLVEKWGQEEVEKLFEVPEEFGPQR